MKTRLSNIALGMIFSSWFLMGCGTEKQDSLTNGDTNKPNSSFGSNDSEGGNKGNGNASTTSPYTRKSLISDVMADPVFGDYGRLLFPVQSSYWSGTTLESLRLTYYNYIDPDETVAIVNYLHN